MAAVVVGLFFSGVLIPRITERAWAATSTPLKLGADSQVVKLAASSVALCMAKVEAFLNSGDFPSHASGGLEALAQALHRRCARVVELQGGRLRT